MSIYLYFLPVSEGQELGSNSAGLRVSHEASLELSPGAVILCRFNRLQDSPPRRLTRVALSRRPQFLTMLACPHNTADGFSLGKPSKGGGQGVSCTSFMSKRQKTHVSAISYRLLGSLVKARGGPHKGVRNRREELWGHLQAASHPSPCLFFLH